MSTCRIDDDGDFRRSSKRHFFSCRLQKTICTTSPSRTLLAKRPVQPHGQLAPLLLCLATDAALAPDDGARDPRDVLAAAGEAGRSSHGLFSNAAATGLADEGSEVCVAHGFLVFLFFFLFFFGLIVCCCSEEGKRGTIKNKIKVDVKDERDM